MRTSRNILRPLRLVPACVIKLIPAAFVEWRCCLCAAAAGAQRGLQHPYTHHKPRRTG